MNRNKVIFYTIWITLLSLGIITVLSNTSYALITKDYANLVYTFQRVFGLTVFSLMFFQLILGSYMDFWIRKLGAWVFRFHINEGIIIYSLIFGHTLSYLVFKFLAGSGFDPFYVYTGFCAICPNLTEFYYTLGRISFWFVTVAVFAGLFRTANQFMQLHWRKFHYLNYATFFLMWIHSLGVGSDIGSMPFTLLHGPSIAIIGVITLHKLGMFFKVRYLYRISKDTGKKLHI